MEGNNNFSFNPDNVGKVEGSFKDKNGESTIVMQGDGGYLNKDVINNASTANNPYKSSGKKLVKTNHMTQNIGPGAQGFAGVALLAGIIALAGIVITYLTLRY